MILCPYNYPHDFFRNYIFTFAFKNLEVESTEIRPIKLHAVWKLWHNPYTIEE
jgi:hypothetical protein